MRRLRFRPINLDILEKDSQNITPFETMCLDEKDRLYHTYRTSYPEFIDFFKKVDTITKHHLIIGINFAYGWMPKVFRNYIQDTVKILAFLNTAKLGRRLNLTEIQTLKDSLSHSIVGTSKLLHFINPSEYAIWDSRVFNYLTGLSPHNYRVENCNLYLDYLALCRNLANDAGYKKVHDIVVDKVGYSVSKLRTIELIMYANGSS